MSRSGYTDACENLAMWRGQVASAIRGKRGQAFFATLIEALDAMPVKELVQGDLEDDSGCVCALGALGRHKGVPLASLDTYDYEHLGKTFDIAHQLAQEVMYENDESGSWKETPDRRWQRIRDWAASKLTSTEQSGAQS